MSKGTNLQKLHDSTRALVWADTALKLLDQRKLPHKETWLVLRDCASVAEAISNMVVRGAPAIGISAAYAAVLAAQARYADGSGLNGLEKDLDHLSAARPTAINLGWAVERMRRCAREAKDNPVATLLAEAKAIHDEDIAANYAMGESGAAFIAPGSGVLTHCNTGSLATGGYGTALGVIRSAWSAGRLETVYADETRPWLQGARLTAWELVRDEIPVTLLVDGAAAWLMKQGKVQWVIVGSDRIAANGDVANKIGTYAAAVAARHHGVKFMVVAPSSTVDMNTACGADIPIEERAQEEVLQAGGQPIAAAGAQAWNPAFDVTPAELVDVIVTERGAVERPNLAKMQAMMAWTGN
ncbi:Methylthioribose-1-phosphate isomerase [hydrothermal vent metagenome]|uniref:Methylthioribose-1-phosphate isomerase n=1 Tax=hydrothermal vent metagenome TaxID=652676 RepID=A0A3B0YKJ0_9ZZZZ